MLKKCISAVLALALVVSIITVAPVTASAETISESGDYQYAVVETEIDEEVFYHTEIIKYNGADENVVIPSSLGGYDVTKIRSNAFYQNAAIIAVTVPDTVTEIGDWAFGRCSALESVSMSQSLVSLGHSVFRECTALEAISLPATLTTVNNTSYGPFTGCTALKSVTLENGMTVIPQYLFSYCPGIETITVPGSVERIEQYAFYNCGSLASVELPDSVEHIGDSAFRNCTSLSSIELPANLTKVESNVFYGCTSLASVDFPDALTEIGSYTFNGCTSLASLDLPDGITKLGSLAFKGCTSLASAYIPASIVNTYQPFSECSSLNSIEFEDGITTIPGNIFYGCTGLTHIDIPATVTSIGSYAFAKCTNLAQVTFAGNSLTSIGTDAFWNCTSLADITLPPSLETLESSAFFGCTTLESINIPASLTYAGNSTYGPFTGCTGLKTVTFDTGVTAVPAYLFARCNGIESIVIPEGVTSVGAHAFDCNNYQSTVRQITLPTTLETIGESAFSYCSAIESIEIPDSVTEIMGYTFNGCTSLASVDLGEGLTVIRGNAFKDCTSLLSLSFPESLTAIDSYAFDNCTSLETLEIPKSFADSGTIGSYPFKNCTSLEDVIFEQGTTKIPDNFFQGSGITSFDIPNTVTHIGEYAFDSCSALESITIPGSVESMGRYAFYNCSALEEVTIPSSLTSIPQSAFYNCTSLAALELPDTLTSIGEYAFYGCTALESVDLPSSLETLNAASFGATGLTEVNIPASLSYASDQWRGPFYNCSNLTTATFEQGAIVIPDYLFSNCNSLEEITIPSTVTAIGHDAFNHCVSLTEVIIPDSVAQIGDYAFNECTALDSITLPQNESFTRIESRTFQNCTALTAVDIPDSVEYIGNYAFVNCSALAGLTLSSSLASIDYGAFKDCDSLTSLTLPPALTNIGDRAFADCDLLASVYIPKSLGEDGSGVSYPFTGCSALKNVSFEQGITAIPDSLFSETGIEAITIPDTVTSIGKYAFYRCPDLEKVVFRADDVVFDSNTFLESTDNVTFYGRHVTNTLRDNLASYYNRPYIGTDAHTGISWTWNGFVSAVLDLSCDDCDFAGESFDAAITSQVTTQPTCTQEGVRTYTATVTLDDGFAYTDQKTQVIPATNHYYNAPEWTWNGYGTAYASFTCAEGDDTQIVNAEITSRVTTDATCTTDGVRTYTAMVIFNNAAYTNKITEVIPALGHRYGDPLWAWHGMDAASAAFACGRCGDVQTVPAELTSEITAHPDCTHDGVRTYTATAEFLGVTYTTTKPATISAKGHRYVNVEWTWNGFETAYTSISCADCGDTQIVNANITSEVTMNPTCTEDGERTYTAVVSFKVDTYTSTKTEVLPATGHSYGTPVWEWDGFTSASASFSCDKNDDTQVIDAVITSEVTMNPTCTENGERTYTATVSFEGETFTDTKTEPVPAAGHHYNTPVWEWSGFNSASATFVCAENDDTQTVTASITSEITKPSTCTEDGKRTYTATVTFEGETFTNQKTVVITATGHHYSAPVWEWDGYTAATAAFACVSGDVTRIENATVTSEETPATCTEDGVRTYTATVMFEGKTYTNKKTETLPSFGGHTYGQPEWTWDDHGNAVAHFTCSRCGNVNDVPAAIVQIAYIIIDGVIYTNAQNIPLRGDADGDGRVNIRDVTAIQRHICEYEPITGINMLAADVNRDGVVDINDATELQKYTAQYDNTLNIGEPIY